MNKELDEIERMFLACADRTRLRLLNLMRSSETSVNTLCEVLNISQPKVSRHLAYLRSMNVVSARRDGKWIYYSIEEPTSPHANAVLNDTLDWLSSMPEMREERLVMLGRGEHLSIEKMSENLIPDNVSDNTYMYAAPTELETFLL
ncbi:MAG: ArsR/SmtB family transcription factor [Blastocatellia bacterium]